MSRVDSSNGLLRVVGAREDRQRGREQRHVARALFGEAQRDAAVVVGVDAGQVAQQLRDDRVALLPSAG